MTQDEKVELYQKHLPLVRHLAGKVAKRYPHVPYDQLVEEGVSYLGWRVADWDSHYLPGRGSPTTWLYRTIYKDMVNICMRVRRPMAQLSQVPKADETARPLRTNNGFLTRLLSNLGSEARVVVETLVRAPSELFEEVRGSAPVRSQQAVRQYLSKRGWSAPRINRAWREVEKCLA